MKRISLKPLSVNIADDDELVKQEMDSESIMAPGSAADFNDFHEVYLVSLYLSPNVFDLFFIANN